jgi:hypothetical protein
MEMTDLKTYTDKPLSEALALLGVEHRRDRLTDADGRHTWTKDGETIGRYTAHEGWDKLQELVATVETERAA